MVSIPASGNGSTANQAVTALARSVHSVPGEAISTKARAEFIDLRQELTALDAKLNELWPSAHLRNLNQANDEAKELLKYLEQMRVCQEGTIWTTEMQKTIDAYITEIIASLVGES